MAFKVNYGQQRAERNQLKAAKKEAKLREQEMETARRKAERDGNLRARRARCAPDSAKGLNASSPERTLVIIPGCEGQ